MYNNILQLPEFYKVGLYIRLSEADCEKSYESESESIINQRNLLMNYVRQSGFTYVSEYIDDGFTGTNFDRPGFKSLIKDIENGKINCVITKDLSRLGRDYIQCGYYVEQYFPGKKIRYISILDQIDTFLETANNDIAPFKALFNDMASKDTSKKIRSILQSKKEQGKFIGSNPCYGYMRDSKDKGHLLPHPDYSIVVKKIFEMANIGIGISEIASYLNNKKYRTPSAVKRKSENSKTRYNPQWTISSVKKILKNRMYTGDMVQNVQTKLSYKSKKKITLDEEFWIVVENTHEPLVNKNIFQRIQNNVKRTNQTSSKRQKRLFENLLFCKECGNALTIAYRKNRNYFTINCNKYSRDPKRHLCESHFMPYDPLEGILLETVKETCKKHIKKINIKTLIKEIVDANKNDDKLLREQQFLEKQKKEITKKIDMLYEDRFNGNISDITYKRLSEETEAILNQTEIKLEKLRKEPKEINIIESFKVYEKKVKDLINLNHPSRVLLQLLVAKIIIDKDKNVEIHYHFKE